jgi:hypothetical protein
MTKLVTCETLGVSRSSRRSQTKPDSEEEEGARAEEEDMSLNLR